MFIIIWCGYDLSLGKGYAVRDGIRIYDVGASKGRLSCMFKTTRRAFQKARELDAKIYHLHDPELIPIGLKLRRMGKKVIFDSHEDVPRQMLYKTHLNKSMLWMIAQGLKFYESYSCAGSTRSLLRRRSYATSFSPYQPLDGRYQQFSHPGGSGDSNRL
jgi:hypothetical protein